MEHTRRDAGVPCEMNDRTIASKVPAITLGFWIIKILATTLGETGGDTITMSWLGETTSTASGYGYLIGTVLVAAPFAILVAAQIAARKFHPYLYWTAIVASTMLGTTLADLADRSLGIGYAGGTAVLAVCALSTLALWHRVEGTIAVNTVNTPRVEIFYWAAITFSQTLGTALGDWMADDAGVGFLGGALVFAAALAVVALLYFRTRVSRVALFWAAFILTRPLGATVGDFLDKPHAEGGLALSRAIASLVLIATIVALIRLLPQKPGTHDLAAEEAA